MSCCRNEVHDQHSDAYIHMIRLQSATALVFHQARYLGLQRTLTQHICVQHAWHCPSLTTLLAMLNWSSRYSSSLARLYFFLSCIGGNTGDNRSTCVAIIPTDNAWPPYQQTMLGPECNFGLGFLHVQSNQQAAEDGACNEWSSFFSKESTSESIAFVYNLAHRKLSCHSFGRPHKQCIESLAWQRIISFLPRVIPDTV